MATMKRCVVKESYGLNSTKISRREEGASAGPLFDLDVEWTVRHPRPPSLARDSLALTRLISNDNCHVAIDRESSFSYAELRVIIAPSLWFD